MPRKANSSNSGEKQPEKKKSQEFGELGEFEEPVTSSSAVPAEYHVPAEDVTVVGYDGSDTPLVDVEPTLKGETVTVHPEDVIPEQEAQSAEKQPEKKTYTEDDVQKMVADAVAAAVAKAMAGMQPTAPQVVQVMGDSEKVHFLWQAEVADDNVVLFGEHGMYGQIVGKTGSFYVPKNDLSRVLTDLTRVFLKKRWLIVVSGLNEEEREALGCDYCEGELLDKKAFAKMVEIGDEMLDIYPRLCAGHKKMVAARYAEAFGQNSPYVTRERVVKLNEMSKTRENPRGDFVAIIEQMNERDAQ